MSGTSASLQEESAHKSREDQGTNDFTRFR